MSAKTEKKKKTEEPTKKKKKEEPEKEEKKKKKTEEPEKEDSDKDEELVIDTKGTPVKLEPGGKLIVQVIAVRDTGKKPSQFVIEIYLDETIMYKSKQPSTGTKWELDEQMQNLDTPKGAKRLSIILKEKGLVGNSFKGEVRLEMESLYDSYPYDKWFDLQNKEGKDKKINGALHIKLQYIGNAEASTEVFRFPLHALINLNRLDIFQKKIDDLQLSKFPVNDKKVTPLLHAAAEGKVGFVKLLIENKASLEEKNSKEEGRNALHLAAIGGHVDVIRYLATVEGTDINLPDESELHHTPLHLAAESNKPEACIWLIKCGANPNSKNVKGNTPLAHALQFQPTSAPQAIPALVANGADIYVTNNDGLAAWDIAQRKELCYSAVARTNFMKATDSVDRREFAVMQYTGQKQRFYGKNMSKDWSTSTQFIFEVDKPIKAAILAYSEKRPDNCEKLVAFCLIKGKEFVHRMPSFHQEGIAFGTQKAYDVDLEPDYAYTAVTYCTDESVKGEFGLCVFTKPGTPKIKCSEGTEWLHHEQVNGAWKEDTAGGSGEEMMSNSKFSLKNKDKKSARIFVMLRQVNKSIDALVFADGGYRITPSKYYVGFYVFDDSLSKEITKTEKWTNSYDVYMTLELDAGETVVIIPTTQKEGEEMDYELHSYADTKMELKKFEEEDD